jgi:GLPGLI family protein
MKKLHILLSLFALSTLNINSQEYEVIDSINYKCQYLYEFQLDSTNINNRRTEDMNLLIGDSISQFGHYSQYILDSLLNACITKTTTFENIIPIVKKNKPSFFTKYYVLKNHKKHSIDLFEHITPLFYQISDNCLFKWELISDSDTTISNYYCQKAKLKFGGRNYTAWYTTEIPISDGPYKFKGLPGLIVKIKDTKNQHIFTLTSFTTLIHPKPLIISTRATKKITYLEYTKAKKMKNEELSGIMYNSNKIQLNENTNALEIEAKAKSKNNFIEKY